MQSHREGLGCVDRDRILRQPTSGLRGHGFREHWHGFSHLAPACSHRARSQIAVAAKDWIGTDVCGGIAVRRLMIKERKAPNRVDIEPSSPA